MNGEWFKDEKNLEASCQNLPSDWYDRQASIEVFRTGTVGESRGFWRAITASEAINFEVSQGISSSNSYSTTVDRNLSLSYEMSMGMGIEGLFSAK